MIREVRPEDTGSITAIYNEYVAHSVILKSATIIQYTIKGRFMSR